MGWGDFLRKKRQGKSEDKAPKRGGGLRDMAKRRGRFGKSKGRGRVRRRARR